MLTHKQRPLLRDDHHAVELAFVYLPEVFHDQEGNVAVRVGAPLPDEGLVAFDLLRLFHQLAVTVFADLFHCLTRPFQASPRRGETALNGISGKKAIYESL